MTNRLLNGWWALIGRCAAAAPMLVLFAAAAAVGASPDTDALRAKYPAYRAALAALGDEQVDTAIAELSKLRASDDASLRADAAFYLGRALVMQQRFEEAWPLFAEITKSPADKMARAGEALYLRGICEAGLLKRQEAIATFDNVSKQQPDAPERMRVDAARQAAELRKIKEGAIEDIQPRMEYSRRRLALEDAGKVTRDRQEEIVAMLTKLIAKADQDEDSGDGQSDGQSGQQSGQEMGKPGPGSGGGNTPGGNKQPSGNEVLRRTQEPGSRSQFGRIRDQQRVERMYGALKTRFPARYKELVEQYYKNLQEDQE